MVENTTLVSLEEAYWWLNTTDAPFLRPPLHELLARLSEAENANDRQAIEAICQEFVDTEFNYLRSPVKETVEKLHNAVKIWIASDIETARKKLNDCGGSYLHNPIYSYVLRMREAVKQDPANAWIPLDRVYSMSRKTTDDLEAGEMLVECGWVLYQMQNRERALRLFQEANQRYNSYNHQIAVVYWMIGFVYWELNQQSKALAAWSKSVSRFEKLASQRITQSGSDTKWYQEVLARLNASIEYAVEHEKSTQELAAAPTKPVTHVAATSPTQPSSLSTKPVKKPVSGRVNKPTERVASRAEAQPVTTYTGDLLEALPVIAEIPAGPWKQTRGDRNIIGQVTIDQVLIDNQPHFVKNLRGGHVISLASIERHVVIKITGDSMNAAQPTPIEDGDYVLLRRQNTAQAGDIVVAKIFDVTSRGPLTTIKRFIIDGHPLLKAESTDPTYGKLDEEFKIDGLAIAVFKPVYKNGISDTKST
jgi:tetratricopeptide (TPR) repeat protein